MRTQFEYVNKECMGELPMQVSSYALEQITLQYRRSQCILKNLVLAHQPWFQVVYARQKK
jgi:hypothetical protein